MTIVIFIISLAAPVFLAFALIRVCWPSPHSARCNLGLQLPLAVGLGLGLASCSYFLWLVAFDKTGASFPFIETAGFVIAAIVLLSRRRSTDVVVRLEPVAPANRPPISRIVIVACATGFTICLATLIVMSLSSPHGDWDAWAIWNLRARFLCRAENWRDAFHPDLAWSHTDYPLLLPGAIARSWTYLGRETTAAPATIGLLFTLSSAALLSAAVAKFRGATSGLLAGSLLLSSEYYLRRGASQYADTPLSFFILATLILTFLHSRKREHAPGLLAIAGLCATCAAWTKNEGLLFLPCWTAALWIVRILPGVHGSRGRSLGAWAAGLLPIGLMVACFKVTLAPASDLANNLSATSIGADLIDPARYGKILRYFGTNLISFSKGVGPVMAAYWLLAGRAKQSEDRRGLMCCALVLVLVALGYFFVYLTTPQDLSWHLSTSGRRLILQLFPSAMFVVFVSAAPMAVRTHRNDM